MLDANKCTIHLSALVSLAWSALHLAADLSAFPPQTVRPNVAVSIKSASILVLAPAGLTRTVASSITHQSAPVNRVSSAMHTKAVNRFLQSVLESYLRFCQEINSLGLRKWFLRRTLAFYLIVRHKRRWSSDWLFNWIRDLICDGQLRFNIVRHKRRWSSDWFSVCDLICDGQIKRLSTFLRWNQTWQCFLAAIFILFC